jgi:hypothetical protein
MMRLTKMSQHTIEKLVRGEPVRRKTRDHVLRVIQIYKSKMESKELSRPIPDGSCTTASRESGDARSNRQESSLRKCRTRKGNGDIYAVQESRR